MPLKISPFRGVRFDFKASPLGAVLCPPYDVIPDELGERLRRRARNAIHLELPAGPEGSRPGRARSAWLRWRESGVLVRDPKPAFYLVEQVFRLGGRRRRRLGLLAALGLDAGTARGILRHERTLPKPKRERTRLLRGIKANTSPIFGVYTDPGGRIRRLLAAARRRRPLAAGVDAQGVAYRLWRADDAPLTKRIARALRGRSLLIADGHHRYEVARTHWRTTREEGAGEVLAYLVAEEDPGLVVHPTHRVLPQDPRVSRALARFCAGRPVGGLAALERALSRAGSPYAFGLADDRLRLMTPANGSGVKSGFGTDWLARRLLRSVDPGEIAYFHDLGEAVRRARERKAAAFLVRPFTVRDIRRAVERAGLLPQKSTYFFPKIATGLVFRAFR